MPKISTLVGFLNMQTYLSKYTFWFKANKIIGWDQIYKTITVRNIFVWMNIPERECKSPDIEANSSLIVIGYAQETFVNDLNKNAIKPESIFVPNAYDLNYCVIFLPHCNTLIRKPSRYPWSGSGENSSTYPNFVLQHLI